MVQDFFSNSYTISPLMDSKLFSLKTGSMICQDADLLIALIFLRFCPELLRFSIQGNRSIANSTISHANEINKRFPRNGKENKTERFFVETYDKMVQENNKRLIKQEDINGLLLDLIKTKRSRILFESFFDEEFYNYALDFASMHDFNRLREVYAVLAVMHAIQSCNISEVLCNNSLSDRYRKVIITNN